MSDMKSEKEFEKYVNIMFTEKGYNVLFNYMKTLAQMYVNKKDSDYPFKSRPVLGLPIFKYSININSKEDLLGRIKSLAQILGISTIEVETKNTTKILDLNGDLNENIQ